MVEGGVRRFWYWIESLADADLPVESVTEIVKTPPRGSDNSPVIAQATGSRRRPFGNAPPVTEQVKGGNPPVKEIAAL